MRLEIATVDQLNSLFVRETSFFALSPISKVDGADPLFRVIKGTPQAYSEIPQADGSYGRYIYEVIGWAIRKPRAEAEPILVQRMLSLLINIRRSHVGDGRSAIEDGYLPWLIERRALELVEEVPEPAGYDFESGIWQPGIFQYATKLTFRICIPGTDLKKVDGYIKDGTSIGYISV